MGGRAMHTFPSREQELEQWISYPWFVAGVGWMVGRGNHFSEDKQKPKPGNDHSPQQLHLKHSKVKKRHFYTDLPLRLRFTTFYFSN